MTFLAEFFYVAVAVQFTSFDTVESEGRQMKQCWLKYIKNPKNSPVFVFNS